MPALQSKGHALPLGQEQRISHLKTTLYFLRQGPSISYLKSNLYLLGRWQSISNLKTLCISSDKRWVFLISNPLCVSLGMSQTFLTWFCAFDQIRAKCFANPFCISSVKACIFLILKPLCISHLGTTLYFSLLLQGQETGGGRVRSQNISSPLCLCGIMPDNNNF